MTCYKIKLNDSLTLRKRVYESETELEGNAGFKNLFILEDSKTFDIVNHCCFLISMKRFIKIKHGITFNARKFKKEGIYC